jgi:predicted transposase YbfD/YdcC
MLAEMDIKDTVITADALNTQKKTCKQIHEQGGFYCFIVKDNHPQLSKDIEDLDLINRYETELEQKGKPPLEIGFHQSVEKAHGRIEVRKIYCSSEINDYVEFPYVRQVFYIERFTELIKKDTNRGEIAYGITNMPKELFSPEDILHYNRNHWGIENKSHYVRDVTFNEDKSKIRKKNGPEIMANIRNLCISMMRLVGIKNIAQGTRDFMMNPELAIDLIGY